MNKYIKILTKKFLIKEYTINKKSMRQIAKQVGCSLYSIQYYLKKFNIKTRTIRNAKKGKRISSQYSKILTKEFLVKEYSINQKSSTQIAKMVGCSHNTVLYWLKIYKIERRTISQSISGNKNSKYIDGRTSKQCYCIDCEEKVSDYRHKRCPICAQIYNWQNEEYRDRVLKAMFLGRNIFPNKPEKQLSKLLNKILPKTYKFVGDGKLIVGGFCPDFVNKDNNKIIELYGDYWHNLAKVIKQDKGRYFAYKRNNYKLLIIWEHELKDLDKVTKSILEFDNE